MSIALSAYSVLNSTEQLSSLADAWNKHNKSRIYRACPPQAPLQVGTPVASQLKSTPATIPKQTTVHFAAKSNPYAIASMNQVLESRKDLIERKRDNDELTGKTSHITLTNLDNATATAKQSSIEMAKIESHLLNVITNTFTSETPAYSNARPKLLHGIRNEQISALSAKRHVVPHGCIACISSSDTDVTRQVYLPITTPSREQLSMCAKDSCYNKNVITNIAEALSRNGVPTVLTSGQAASNKPNHLHIDISEPVTGLGTTECCEGLLFGNNRITSSPEFSVGCGIGTAYAEAVHAYQKYSNVAIGTHITLIPSASKGTMQVLSMTCPEMSLSHTVTRVSGIQTHPKYGPNHTTRIVEIMQEVAPFAKLCSETYMGLPHETVQDVQEDSAMPLLTSGKTDHCFAHSTEHGVSAYVANHSFAMSTEMLNTYTTTSAFPPVKDFTVHVACIYGGTSGVRDSKFSVDLDASCM
jgi:hypothetical protein